MPDCALYWHSSIPASMHPCVVHCPGPCRMTKSVLLVHVHAVCTCPCCMSMCMLHSMSMLHVYVNAAFHINAAFHVNAAFYVNASCPCLCPCTSKNTGRPASGQSGTGLKNTDYARTGPVPD
jgi:hypothetical protein